MGDAQPTPTDEQLQILAVNRAALATISILACLLTVLGAVLYRRLLNQAALPLLLDAQAVLVLCAFTVVGLARYAMGLWPLVIAGIIAGAPSLVNYRQMGSESEKRP